MAESDNMELVRRFCAAWAKADLSEILDFFTDDAVYNCMPIQGKDAIRGMIELFTAPFERGEWEVKQIAAAGDTVLTERVDRFTGADRTVDLPVMGAFQIREGKIAAWRDYFDMADWTRQTS